jgi:selenocysteine-specific elongation factor
MGTVLIEADGVRLQEHSARFEGDLDKTREKILDSYMNAGLATPSRSNLIRELEDSGYSKPKEVVDSLLEMGYLVPLTHDLLIHSAVLEKAKKALIDELNTQDGITVSRARSILGTTRKYTVPLLELLDRQGFTVRRGDARVLSSNIDITTAGDES